MKYHKLFSPTQLGDISLPNRIVMAPMTRSRADAEGNVSDLHTKYYAQRASAGLIITEGTQPSIHGQGYARTPGIHTDEHVAQWKKVTDTVAEAGGQMVMQIMHVGRISSHHNKLSGARTVAPSVIVAKGEIYTDAAGMQPHDVPEELSLSEIPSVIEEYAQATERAAEAGMAGVELHATSGYLPAQFLSTGTNRRKDNYGGPAKNRIRFVVETLEAMTEVIGAGRVGIRICPGNPFNDLSDEDPQETFTELLKAISPMNLAYLHVIRMPNGPVDNIALARNHFTGPIMVNDSYSAEEAEGALDDKITTVSFGRNFIGNPDFVEKTKEGRELDGFDHKTLYTPGKEGYTDY